jgi:hypothetical protein
MLNGESRKTRSAIAAAVRVERWRTSPHSAIAVAMKQIRPEARSARSAATPRSMTIAAIAWNSGNSNGACHGGPNTGSCGLSRLIPCS